MIKRYLVTLSNSKIRAKSTVKHKCTCSPNMPPKIVQSVACAPAGVYTVCTVCVHNLYTRVRYMNYTVDCQKRYIRYLYFLRIGRQTQPVNVRAEILKPGNFVCHTFFFQPVPVVLKKLLADLKSDFLPKDLGYAQDGPQSRRPGFSCADRHRAGR